MGHPKKTLQTASGIANGFLPQGFQLVASNATRTTSVRMSPSRPESFGQPSTRSAAVAVG